MSLEERQLQIAAAPLSEPIPSATSERRRKPLWREQYVLVVAGAALGALLGALFPSFAVELKPLGDVFISLIKMTIAPLIFLVVVTGIAQVGDMRAVGRIGLKAFAYFEAVTTICLLFSFVVVQLGAARRGRGARHRAAGRDGRHASARPMSDRCRPIFSTWCPESFVGAFAAGDVLQVLVLALSVRHRPVVARREGRADARRASSGSPSWCSASSMSWWRWRRSARSARWRSRSAKFGAATLYALALLVGTAWAMMAFFIFVVLGTICRLVGIRLMDLLRLLRTELLVVLGTSSSETAIPGMMEKLPAAGVGRAVAGLVIPSGYSFNLDGVALTLAALDAVRRPGLRHRARSPRSSSACSW